MIKTIITDRHSSTPVWVRRDGSLLCATSSATNIKGELAGGEHPCMYLYYNSLLHYYKVFIMIVGEEYLYYISRMAEPTVYDS